MCSNSEKGYTGLSVEQGKTQFYSGNKTTLVNILREQGKGMNFILGHTECGYLENPFGTIRPLRQVQTQINLRICMSLDDITFMLTVLYDGQINK